VSRGRGLGCFGNAGICPANSTLPNRETLGARADVMPAFNLVDQVVHLILGVGWVSGDKHRSIGSVWVFCNDHMHGVCLLGIGPLR